MALPIQTRTLKSVTRQGVHERCQEYTRGSDAQTTSRPQRRHHPQQRDARTSENDTARPRDSH